MPNEKPYIINGKHVSHEEYKKLKYEDVRIRVPKGQKETIKTFAESNGESLNAFVNRLINEAMEKDTPKE